MDDNTRIRLEREWVDHLMANAPNWRQLLSTHRAVAHQGRTFIAWEVVEGAPVILALFKVEDISVTIKDGLEILLVNSHGKYFCINSRPKEVLKDLYLWVPAMSDLHYTPTNFQDASSPRRLSATLCIKMRSRSDSRQIERHCYCAPVREFSAIWPNII